MPSIAREHAAQTPMQDAANATGRSPGTPDDAESHVRGVDRDDLYAEDVDLIVYDDDDDREFDDSLDDD